MKNKNLLFSAIIIFGFLLNSYSQHVQKIDFVKTVIGDSMKIIDDICVDSSNNIYITGGFTGTIDLDLKSGVYQLTNTQGYSYFLAKYNENLDLIWAQVVGPYIQTGSMNSSIDVNSNSEIIYLDAAGNFNKFDTDGNLLWNYTMPMPSYPKVECDETNSIIITGIMGAFDFDFSAQSLILNSGGGCNLFLAKYDSDALIQWAFALCGSPSLENLNVDNNNNILINGVGVVNDFDPSGGVTSNAGASFIAKYNSNGAFLFTKVLPVNNDIKTNSIGEIFITGGFSGTQDFDPGPALYNLTSIAPISNSETYVLKLDQQGSFLWAKSYPLQDQQEGLLLCPTQNNIYILENWTPGGNGKKLRCVDSIGNSLSLHAYSFTGNQGAGNTVIPDYITTDFNGRDILIVGRTNDEVEFQDDFGFAITPAPTGIAIDAFILRIKNGLAGRVFKDWNVNGIMDLNEPGFANSIVQKLPNEELLVSDSMGYYFLDDVENIPYTFTIGNINNYSLTTGNQQLFIPNSGNDSLPFFGYSSDNPCTSPEISIFMPTIRRCFSGQIIYVSVCNLINATAMIDSSSFVDVQLNQYITPNSATIPFIGIGNNIYRFSTGDIYPGQCVNFQISTSVSCLATQASTQCISAELSPFQNCVLDTLESDYTGEGSGNGGVLNGLPQPCTSPWDNSSFSVNGWCQDSSIYFTVTNNGPMGSGVSCYAPLWITVDGVLFYTDSVIILGGQTLTYSFPGNGQTWIFNVEQHPLHPGNSHPNAFVERCGDSTLWTPDNVNDFPQDDADPVIDIYCGTVFSSFDPNDKKGYPYGYGIDNLIQPNQQIQYMIRFQNTGNDTAFTVVVRDTLDFDLNIFTVTPGVSSHPYEYRMYGPRIIEWTFNNILLPDSTTNSVGSNGFVTFHVEQNPDLIPGTVIYNDADIYFDYNDPITTNTTVHRIYDGFVAVTELLELNKKAKSIFVYPNPTNGELTLEYLNEQYYNNQYFIYDQLGRNVLIGKIDDFKKVVLKLNLPTGFYFLKIDAEVVKFEIIK